MDIYHRGVLNQTNQRRGDSMGDLYTVGMHVLVCCITISGLRISIAEFTRQFMHLVGCHCFLK